MNRYNSLISILRISMVRTSTRSIEKTPLQTFRLNLILDMIQRRSKESLPASYIEHTPYQYQNDEIEFLISCFTENGYDKDQLSEIVQAFRNRRDGNKQENGENDEPTNIVTLPWIPGLSPKLKKTYRKHGYKAVFKSSANLKTLLTS